MAEIRPKEQGVKTAMALSRRYMLSAVMAGSVVLVSGCSVIPKGPAKSTTPTDQLPTDGLPVDKQRHRVALLVPLTGPNSALGDSIANAANMAVLDTGGTKLRLTIYDTGLTNPSDAAAKAIAEGNKLILGPVLAEEVRGVVDKARAAKIPLISFANDTSVAGKGVYVMGFTPGQAMERIVRYADIQGKKRFAALAPIGIYGDRSIAAFKLAVQSTGGTLVGTETYDRDKGGIGAAAARLAKAGPADAVLVADSGRVAAQAVPFVRRANSKAQILGTELWNTDPTIAKMPPLQGAWFSSVSDGVYNQLVTKYQTRFGKAPYRLASLGYDSILLVTKVANGWKPGTSFPLTLLEDRGGFSGIDGAFRFLNNGIAERALEVQRVTPQGALIIAPAPKTFLP